MFTLIKREIEDHLAHFLAAVILSVIIVVLSIWAIYNYYRAVRPWAFPNALSTAVVVALVLALGLFAMGAGQMYMDRTRRVSAFLSVLPVSRRRILLARIITGVLAILTLFIPLGITSAIVWRLLTLPSPMYQVYHGLFWEIFIAAFLMCFACYGLGLQTGWTSSKAVPTLAALTLTFVLVSLIVVKGFGLDTIIILILFIIGSVTRTWQKSKATAL